MEQILQTLLQNQTSNSAMTPPAAKCVILSLKPTLREASALLNPIAYDWHNIGIQLNLENDALKVISMTVVIWLRTEWLNRAIPPPTWKELAEALGDADHQNTARKIRRV